MRPWVRSEYAPELAVVSAWLAVLIPWNVTLSRLSEVGIVHYDADAGVIEATDRANDIAIYLEIVPGHELPWRELYLSMGAISCALAASLWLEIYPLSHLSNLTWLSVVAGTFTLTAIAHIYYERNMRLGHGDQPPELSYTE
mgnify:CR=1 FL=1